MNDSGPSGRWTRRVTAGGGRSARVLTSGRMGERDEPWFQTPIPPTPIHHQQCGIALDRTIGVSQDRIDGSGYDDSVSVCGPGSQAWLLVRFPSDIAGSQGPFLIRESRCSASGPETRPVSRPRHPSFEGSSGSPTPRSACHLPFEERVRLVDGARNRRPRHQPLGIGGQMLLVRVGGTATEA